MLKRGFKGVGILYDVDVQVVWCGIMWFEGHVLHVLSRMDQYS